MFVPLLQPQWSSLHSQITLTPTHVNYAIGVRLPNSLVVCTHHTHTCARARAHTHTHILHTHTHTHTHKVNIDAFNMPFEGRHHD